MNSPLHNLAPSIRLGGEGESGSPSGPKYKQLAEHLRDYVKDLTVGDKLPPEAELISTYNTSRNTFRNAIALLRQEGLIESRSGAGTFVTNTRQRSAQKKNIQVILPTQNYLYWYQIMDGVHESLNANDDCQLIYANAQGDNVRFKQLIENALSSDVDGIIIMTLYGSDLDKAWSQSMRSQFTPLVLVNDITPGYKGLHVKTDDKAGIKLALKHLKKLGHTDISFLAGANCSTHKERQQAYIEFMTEEGLDMHIFNVGASYDDGYRFARDEIESGNWHSAIVAVNDFVALGVAEAANESNLSFPLDYSLVGFGNLEDQMAHRGYRFSSIAQDAKALGQAAGQSLIHAIEGTTPPSNPIIPVTFVDNGSTAAPRGVSL